MSTLTVTIASTSYNIQVDSLSLPDRIEERSKCSMVIQTDLSTTFSFGQRVIVTDSSLGLLFSGIVNTDSYERIHPNDRLEHSIDCIDCTFDVDRLTSDETYTEQYAGVIVADQHAKHLAAEGITAAYALDIDSEQTDFAAGTLSGTVATTTDDGSGCLELAKAGIAVAITQESQSDFNAGISATNTASPSTGGVQLASTSAIKYQATQGIPGLANAYDVVKIWAGSYTIVSGDVLSYDVWIADTSPEIKAAADFVCSDGTTLHDASVADAQNVSASHNNDLAGLAKNTWYSRSFTISGGGLNGKTISYACLNFGGDSTGTYTAYFRKIYITNGVTTKVVIFDSAATALALNPPQQMQCSGYSDMSCTIVTGYERHGNMFSAYYDISAASIVQSSRIAWDVTLPENCTLLVTASIDSVASAVRTYLPCTTNGGAIPGLLPGLNLAGRDVIFCYTLDNSGNDPTVTPFLSRVTALIESAYSCSKSDSATYYHTTSEWNTGTLTNLITNGNAIQLNGFARNWDDANFSNQTVFGSASPSQSINIKQLKLSSGTSADVRSRLDFAGIWQNFTMEADVQVISTTVASSFVYRCTNWGNSNDSYAYAVAVFSDRITLARGTNSTGAGGFTSIATATYSLSAGTYRLKVVVNGSSHQAYLNDTLYINATDGAYTAAGYVGLRMFNNSGSTTSVVFDNFGIVAALSGTWTSPAIIDISALGTILNSALNLEIDPGVNLSMCSFLAELSLNNGSTWTALTNRVGDQSGYYQAYQLPGLVPGTNVGSITQLKIRLTLTTSTASVGETIASSVPVVPKITCVSLFVVGPYSSSGTRVSLLSLTPAGRVGSTLVATNANMPGGTALFLATSPDNATWTNVSSGSPIPGIVQQVDPVVDTFGTNTSGFYINTAITGGSSASIAYDIANSRITLSGGSSGLFRYDALYVADGYVEADLDQAANSGLAARITGPNTLYALYVWDASASGTPNTFKLDSIVSGTHTTLLTGSISFVRGTYHKFRLSCIGTTISATMDGVSLGSVTNSAVTGPGKFALLTNTLLRCYNLRMQALGDDLTGHSVYVRTTLVTVDPTATPQQLSLTVAALSPDIGIGALIPSEVCNNDHADKVIGDIAGPSDYYWFVRPDKSLVARARQADPAPWILTGDDTMITSGPTVEINGDNYRNRQIVRNVTDTISFTDRKTGDGSTRSWTLKYKLASAPSVLLNGQPATVAPKGTTGSNFYYEVGSDTLTQDDSGAILEQGLDYLDITATGQTTTTVTRNNTGKFPGTISQSDFKTLTGGGTGIVTDVADGSGISVDDAEVWADGLLKTFGRIGRSTTFTTKRPGLKSGQYLTAINPQILLNDASLLITSVALSYYAGKTTFFDVEAVEGPNNGSWAKIIGNVLGLTKAPRGITTKRRKKRVATTVLYSASASYTTSGNSADLPVDDLLELAVDVNVTAKSGTSPTLVLSIERKGADGAYYQIWASSSITNTGKQSTSIGTGMTTAQSFGSLCRLVWTIGGTTPSWTLTASIIGK